MFHIPITILVSDNSCDWCPPPRVSTTRLDVLATTISAFLSIYIYRLHLFKCNSHPAAAATAAAAPSIAYTTGLIMHAKQACSVPQQPLVTAPELYDKHAMCTQWDM